jgi:hypothetical protein
MVLMKNIFVGVIILVLAFFTKYLLWDLNISSGKLVGTIQHIGQKGNFLIFKNWEGIILENGKPIPFSVKDNRIGLDLLRVEGKRVILFYNQNLISWPRKTDISISGWKFQDSGPKNSDIISIFEKSLFCSFLGSLLNNQDLYQKVKEFMRAENIYLYNQYQKCND